MLRTPAPALLPTMEVIVVGAGIGGLSVALALGRSGHRVSVLEQAPVFTEAGAGIQIGANGSRILHHWGLLDPLLEKAQTAPFGRLGDGWTAKTLCKFPLSRFAESRYHFPHLQVHRADLHEVLLAACGRLENVQILADSRVVQIQQKSGKVSCQTQENKKFDAELLIGADGMRSTVAEHVFARPPAEFSGKVAWRALVNRDEIEGELDLRIPHIWMAPGKHLVHYPIRGGRQINLVACVDSSEPAPSSWNNPQSADQVRHTFKDFAPGLQRLIAPLQQSYLWGLYESQQHAWVEQRVLLLGDAAHSMLPSMAQGAVMALEDAAILDQLLQKTDTRNLADALDRYQRLRSPRTSAVQQTARINLEVFHQRSGLARSLRLAGMSMLGDRAEKIIGQRYDWIYGFDPFSAVTKAV